MKRLMVLILSVAAFGILANRLLSHGPGTIEILIDPRIPLPQDGGLKDKEVALTFDDGPNPELTPRILASLRKFGIKALFFQVGKDAEAHPEITKRILIEGHSLGTHSWDHSDLASLPIAQAIDNVKKGHLAVEAAAGNGFHTSFFRYPNMNRTDELDRAVTSLGLLPVQVNIVPEDWLPTEPKALLEKTLRVLTEQGKGILLFHDVQKPTADMMDDFLTELLARGYKPVIFRQKTADTQI